MRLILVGLTACLVAAPAMAQKFVSVSGENTRTTVGAIAAQEAEAPQEIAAAADAPVETDAVEGEVLEGEQVAEAETEVTLPPPATVKFGDPVETFIADAGECNPGSHWNQATGRCAVIEDLSVRAHSKSRS